MTGFLPRNMPGSALLRCIACGSLIIDDEVEIHIKWHEKIDQFIAERTGDGK